MHWLIRKFTLIAKGARLIFEQLDKIIIEDDIIKQEKEALIEMLYNKEVVLTYDFMEMRKDKIEVVLLQKSQTSDYKAWQVPQF